MVKIETQVTGRVIAVVATVGQHVAVGATVATVESMKMEIPVEAECAGVVSKILIAAGDEVEEGQALIEME